MPNRRGPTAALQTATGSDWRDRRNVLACHPVLCERRDDGIGGSNSEQLPASSLENASPLRPLAHAGYRANALRTVSKMVQRQYERPDRQPGQSVYVIGVSICDERRLGTEQSLAGDQAQQGTSIENLCGSCLIGICVEPRAAGTICPLRHRLPDWNARDRSNAAPGEQHRTGANRMDGEQDRKGQFFPDLKGSALLPQCRRSSQRECRPAARRKGTTRASGGRSGPTLRVPNRAWIAVDRMGSSERSTPLQGGLSISTAQAQGADRYARQEHPGARWADAGALYTASKIGRREVSVYNRLRHLDSSEFTMSQVLEIGGPCRGRTCDQLIKRDLVYSEMPIFKGISEWYCLRDVINPLLFIALCRLFSRQSSADSIAELRV